MYYQMVSFKGFLGHGFRPKICLGLIFHQSLWYLFNQIGLIPPERPAWPLDPITPFGVPSVISKAFWGGLWGGSSRANSLELARHALLDKLDRGGRGSAFARRLLRRAAIKSEPIPELWPRFLASLMLNGAWGFGTALFLKLFGAARSN
jgi:hypothetical protein